MITEKEIEKMYTVIEGYNWRIALDLLFCKLEYYGESVVFVPSELGKSMSDLRVFFLNNRMSDIAVIITLLNRMADAAAD